MVQILTMYRSCPGLRYCPITLNQYAFTAGTVHLLSATQNSDESSRKAKSSIEAVHTCINALEEMGDTLECAVQSAATLRKLLEESNCVPAPKFVPPSAVSAAQEKVSIEQLLKDPSVAAQLRQLGWEPPTPVPPTPTTTNHHHQPHVPVTTTGPRGQGIDFDWFTTPISYQSMAVSTPAASALVAAPDPTASTAAGHATLTVPGSTDGASLAALETSFPLSEVLYAGAPSSPFPAGNVWTWPFNFDGQL